MSLSAQQAAAALAQIDATTQRAQVQRGYRGGGGILMMWSVLWALGYLGMAWLPSAMVSVAWFALAILGTVLSLHAARGGLRMSGPSLWRLAAGAGFCMVFVTAIVVLAEPKDPAFVVALPGLFIGLVYAAAGVFAAPRYLVIAGYVLAVTVVGYLGFRAALPYWMAASCLGLLLGGYWLRRG